MSPGVWLLVAVAGGLGAVCRYTLDFVMANLTGSGLPWGTWAVNITGAFGLGLLMGVALRGDWDPAWVAIVGGGFFGAYTTFSTWMYESVRLLETGKWKLAILNIGGSLITGLLAAWLGLMLVF